MIKNHMEPSRLAVQVAVWKEQNVGINMEIRHVHKILNVLIKEFLYAYLVINIRMDHIHLGKKMKKVVIKFIIFVKKNSVECWHDGLILVWLKIYMITMTAGNGMAKWIACRVREHTTQNISVSICI